MFWIICALLTAITLLAIFAPFMQHRRQPAAPTAAYDLRVYRDQLREVERDLERGVIEQADAARLRVEIGRKVLEADRALAGATVSGKAPPLIWPALALIAIGGGAFWVYASLGAPDLPDAPIAARHAAAEAQYTSRPSQAEAVDQARPTMPPQAPADPQYLDLIERLRAAIASRPDDITGLRLLAEHEARLGNPVAAAAAQEHLLDLLGRNSTAEDHARMAALMIESAGGLITAEAESHLAMAIRKDPKNGQARYLGGLLQIQNGRPDRAFPIWANLLAEGPETAPWIAPIRAVITDLAWFAGEARFELPPPGMDPMPLSGPDEDAITAAGEMTPEQRQQMITGMVDGLQDRLKTQGGPPEEWARLIGALGVLDRQDEAHVIWQEAQGHFDQPDARALLDDAARQAGLTE